MAFVKGRSNLVEDAGRIADSPRLHVHPFEEGEVKVGHGRAFRGLDYATGLECAIAAPSKNDGKVIVVVTVSVGDSAAVDDHGPIEERVTITIRRLLHPSQEVGELLDVEA